MDKSKIRQILKDVRSGKKGIAEALEALKTFPFEDMGFAKIDTHRALRRGYPEVVFAEGKSLEHIKRIFAAHKENNGYLMATRASRKVFEVVREVKNSAKYFEEARIILSGRPARPGGKKITVVTAGTADIPVAEEAAVTATILGNRVERVYDVGVAGIHRLFAGHKKLRSANVIIVVAGMEGALASIVGGIVESPVIAVPTSVGYGASFKGLAPLLTMLNSCAPGIGVVNIDNGFGAAYLASLINRAGR
ncbi:MAG: nickel pincer cofactor biosynthesis protein LarB [Candidatus Omnitrophica bacterium]|nr:nickel pincer cofactor biosynthesis protein LarB [Candidatus Omnitrophota bacterium]